ncbi:hypothetical protein [Terrabacter carboxydivorans]|uniref:Uncharacterized protein n=1 Tax=Terrabacter carboxydivorans TaxID=619730 RepID=A0ABN3MIF2_9MICO
MSGIASEDFSATYDKRGRRRISVGQVASRLDLRLHGPDVDSDALAAGCQLAIDHRLAAVTCRPEHVHLASVRLAGTGVGVATGLGFNQPMAAAVNESELCPVPGLMEALIPRKDESHGSTEEVPGGASGASDQDGRRSAA